MKHYLLTASLAILICSVSTASTTGPHPVTLETKDGIAIQGWYIHPGSHQVVDEENQKYFAEYPAVVLLHMFRGSKEDWGPLFGEFFTRDIAALAIDMRGHGQSTAGLDGADLSKLVRKRDEELFKAMWQDAAAAVDWLVAKGHKRERIAIVGASVGCSVAIDCARRDPAIRVVATLSPGANYLGVDTLSHLQDWGDRSLLIVSSEGEWVRGAKKIHDLLEKQSMNDEVDGNQSQHTELWLLDGTGGEVHGTYMFGKVQNMPTRLTDWLEEQLSVSDAPKEQHAIE